MTWAIHCRETYQGKRYAVFSTVIMDYIHDGFFGSEEAVADWILTQAMERWQESVARFGRECVSDPPELSDWMERAKYASEWGNSEYYGGKPPYATELHGAWW